MLANVASMQLQRNGGLPDNLNNPPSNALRTGERRCGRNFFNVTITKNHIVTYSKNMVTNEISKSQLKAKALEYFCQVEADGAPIVVTDHGEAIIGVRRYRAPKRDLLALLRGTAVAY